MDAVEKAIRNALEKGDANDRAFREKVYRSAFAALERSLKAKPDITPGEAERRRDSLKHGITQIESEFVPAVAQPDATEAPADEPRAVPETEVGGEERSADELPADRDDAAEELRPSEYDATPPEDPEDPAFENKVSDETIDVVQADERERWRPARRPRLGSSRIPVLAVAVLVLVVVAGAVWWAMVGGGSSRRPAVEQEAAGEATVDDILREQSGGGAPADNTTDDTGDDEAATESGEDWITVFSPSDATAISAPPGTEAQIMEGEDQPFVRLTSPDPKTALRFDVGQGVLEVLSGSGIVFSIVARAEEGAETETSVSCDLGAMGDCGRKRFVVGATRSEYLLEVDTSGSAPDAAGTISIVPDITGEGRALDLFEIRASRTTR